MPRVPSRLGQVKPAFRESLMILPPKVSESYGVWQRVDYLDDMKADSQPRRPGVTENFEIRLRVPDWQSP